MLQAFAFACLLALVSGLSDRNELFQKYGEIFPNNNRNAASHRWATYILERSETMTETVLRDLFAGFCPISGSPLDYNRGILRVQMTLPAVYGGNETGMMYYCCWPCVCDTADFLKVDTKTIKMSTGEKQMHFVVIGNPCKNSAAIPWQAPDVKCEANQDLVKATLSDHGHIIIGMIFEAGIKDHSDAAAKKSDEAEYTPHCQSRAASGHNSGMGTIFREVAAITPIQITNTGKLQLQNGAAAGVKAAPEQGSGMTSKTQSQNTSVQGHGSDQHAGDSTSSSASSTSFLTLFLAMVAKMLL